MTLPTFAQVNQALIDCGFGDRPDLTETAVLNFIQKEDHELAAENQGYLNDCVYLCADDLGLPVDFNDPEAETAP